MALVDRRISIHIGHAKCASTTLQAALGANLDALRARGAVVADRQLRFPTEGPVDGPPTFYIDAMCDREEDGLREGVQRIHEQIESLPDRFEHLILSAESLVRPRAQYLAKALAPAYRVEVIYYVRRPQDFLVSAWAQWGCLEGMPMRGYVEREFGLGRPAYWQTASNWHDFAGNCYVRPLHSSALRGGDVVRDFFAALGYPDLIPTVPDQRNPMLDWSVLEVFADCPFLFEDIHDTALGDWLKQNGAAGGERPKLPRDLVEQVRDRYDDDNRRLHARYFPDVDFDEVLATRLDDSAPDQRPEEELADQLRRMRQLLGVQLDLLRRTAQG